MKRFELSLLIGIVVSVLCASLGAFGVQAQEVRHEVVRLHVLANSDSEEDQQLKLAVRDALLEQTQEIFQSSADRLEAEQAALDNLPRMEEIARQEIARQGYDYPVTARLVNMYFETRRYEDVTLPAGRYDAVRIEIGQGTGKNWWCVMFPPMCVPAAAQDQELPLEEQIRELGESQPHYQPKFAVVELLESLQNRLGGGESEAAAALVLAEEQEAGEKNAS